MKTHEESISAIAYDSTERGYLLYLATKLGVESAEARASMNPPVTIRVEDAEYLAKHATRATRVGFIDADLWDDLLVAYGTVTPEQAAAGREKRRARAPFAALETP